MQFDKFDSPLSLDHATKVLLSFERTNCQRLFLQFLRDGYWFPFRILLNLSAGAPILLKANSKG